MMDIGDGFLILPGGVGTLDEFFEVLTSIAIGSIDKPVAYGWVVAIGKNYRNYYKLCALLVL